MTKQRRAGLRPVHFLIPALFAAVCLLLAQDKVVLPNITGGQQPAIAIPDFRGVAEAQGFMPAFNQTLWSDVSNGAVFKMQSKSYYPKFVPQQPSDFTTPPAPVQQPPARRGQKRPEISVA